MADAPPSDLALTLVRHGETDWNVSRRTQGHDDRARLSAAGRAQASEVAATLATEHFDVIVASDLSRARETATIIAEVLTLDVEYEPLLRERNFGVLEGAPHRDLTGDLTGIVDDVVVDPDARPPGGESFRDVVERARRFVDATRFRYPDSKVLVVTHGGMIRALRAYYEGAPLEGLRWGAVGNCSVWRLCEPATE